MITLCTIISRPRSEVSPRRRLIPDSSRSLGGRALVRPSVGVCRAQACVARRPSRPRCAIARAAGVLSPIHSVGLRAGICTVPAAARGWCGGSNTSPQRAWDLRNCSVGLGVHRASGLCISCGFGMWICELFRANEFPVEELIDAIGGWHAFVCRANAHTAREPCASIVRGVRDGSLSAFVPTAS